MTLSNLVHIAGEQLDSLLIGRFVGPVALGLYRQAYNLVMLPIERLNQPIRRVAAPGLSILQSEPERYRRYYGRILFALSLPTIPFGVFTAIYAHEIVLIVLGQKWLGSVVFLRIFGIVAAIRPALSTSEQILFTRGKSGKLLLVSFVSTVLLLILMSIGITWGAVGVATARIATPVLLAPWILYFSFAETPVSVGDFLRTVSRPVVASLAMAAALALLKTLAHLESALLSLTIGCGTAIAVYLLAYSLLPGGLAQLQFLARELTAALRRRTSGGSRPDRTRLSRPELQAKTGARAPRVKGHKQDQGGEQDQS